MSAYILVFVAGLLVGWFHVPILTLIERGAAALWDRVFKP